VVYNAGLSLNKRYLSIPEILALHLTVGQSCFEHLQSGTNRLH